MTAVNQNFSMTAGDSKNVVITVSNDEGIALNLTGASVKWALKKRVTSTENELYKTNTDGITITDAANGVITIKLVPVDTTTLNGTYHHECEVTDANGNVSTVTVGSASISRSGV
jgi:hypothetical protein